MDTDLNEVVNSAAAYIESYLKNMCVKYMDRLAPIFTYCDSCHFTNTKWK